MKPLRVVTFSGIDGAGKSTQILALERWLREAGWQPTLLTFWDNVVMFSGFREFMSHKTFGGDQGIGSPEKPLQRRDKNVTAWPVTAMRFCLYFADAVNSRRVVARTRKSGADVLILDRYIYDELANLPLKSFLARCFIKFTLWLAPTPDVAYLIDADPVAAQTRKPEYPLHFVHRNRDAYITLSHLAKNITLVHPQSVAAMETEVREEFLRAISIPPSQVNIPVLQ
jgi:thymidylate kinase